MEQKLEQETDGAPKRGRKDSRRLQQITLGLAPGDVELIDFIVEFLGSSSRADAIRTAIRTYAMHLEMLNRGRRK